MIPVSADPPRPAPPQPSGPLWEAARALESGFLSQMLAAAGLGTVSQDFGGGAGEDQFASLLTDERAKTMTAAGGIGLAESIFRALSARDGR